MIYDETPDIKEKIKTIEWFERKINRIRKVEGENFLKLHGYIVLKEIFFSEFYKENEKQTENIGFFEKIFNNSKNMNDIFLSLDELNKEVNKKG